MGNQIIRFTFFFIIIFNFIIVHADNNPNYELDDRIRIQEGLSQSRVLSIIEDQRGFMWFGTADGLNRYDGYNLKIFRNIYNDSTSLPNNSINTMVEDSTGNIWIGTNEGIVIFNPYTEVFKTLKDNDSFSNAVGSNRIKLLTIDKQNNIWANSLEGDVFSINPTTLKKERLLIDLDYPCNKNRVSSIYIDSNNRLWIGGYFDCAAIVYQIDNKSFDVFTLEGVKSEQGDNFSIGSFFEDNKNRIWLGLTDDKGIKGGLFYLEEGDTLFINNKILFSDNYYLPDFNRLNNIAAFSKGDDESFWFANSLGGIYDFIFGETPKVSYVKPPIEAARINTIYRSKNGILWIGTNGYGVEMSVANTGHFKLLSSKTNTNFKIVSIRAITEDNDNYWIGGYYGLARVKKDFSDITMMNYASVYSTAASLNDTNIIWTGSEGGGLRPFNKISNSFIDEEIKLDSSLQIAPKYVYIIYPVVDTLLLLGTTNGLIGYNPISKIMTLYRSFCKNTKQEVTLQVRTIYTDKLDNILISYVNGGIGKLNLNNKRVEKFQLGIEMKGENNYNPVNCIYNDNENNYWLATNNGLIKYNAINNSKRLFTEIDGLPNNHIYGILPDGDNNIWLSTNNGLSVYSINNDEFRNYELQDGLQNTEFNTGSYFKAKDGTMIFGGINGLNYFNPNELKPNKILPKIVITDIKVAGKDVLLSRNETKSNMLVIQPYENSFSIEFAGLSYIASKNNEYRYRIKNLDTNWLNVSQGNHKIVFNSLDHGVHTFEILAANNDGLWLKKPFSFTVVKKPTFFETVLFKIILALSFLLAVWLVYKTRLRRITAQRNKLQIFADKQTANLIIANNTLRKEITGHKDTSEALKASNITKDKFLSIMAHDIINPLGVIVGFSDLLVDKENNFNKEDKTSFLKTINITSKGLTSLLSNLLQWSRLQNNTIDPKPKIVNLKNSVTDTIIILHGNIVEKQIRLVVNIDDKVTVFVDTDMLLTILRNLISNAIKFTPVSGSVNISAKQITKMVEISISDTGVGIPTENLEKLFNPDNNISTKGTSNESGTGLGLGLVYEFVILNDGKIWVESEVGRGSEFYFSLPTEQKN